jgi:hypothetical protein
MDSGSRHQCLIYEGSPSRQLPGLAAQARQKLRENFRCLYLNTPAMVAGMRCYLAAADVDVTHEITKGSLVLSPEREHLTDGKFDVERMISSLEDTVRRALNDGYKGCGLRAI